MERRWDREEGKLEAGERKVDLGGLPLSLRLPIPPSLLLRSPARMKLPMDGLQPILIDMRINLCRADIAVAQQFLHYAQIRPAADQVGRETMAERVRGYRFQQSAPTAIFFHQIPKTDALHRLAGARNEQPIRHAAVELGPA